jgi:serine/threonine protein kinase
MAPERLDGQPLDYPSDVYSYAITAWELYSGEGPFHGVPEGVLPRIVVDKKEHVELDNYIYISL